MLPVIYNEQQNIYKKYSSIWYLYTITEILIDWFSKTLISKTIDVLCPV